MSKKFKTHFQPDDALVTPNMHRPVSRRDMIAQGFRLGTGAVVGSTALGLLSAGANAQLSQDLLDKLTECEIPLNGAGKIPFVCFDLAGGANFAGSNVLIGGRGGQLDFISTAGYNKQGLPGDQVPSSSTENFIDERLGLRFHTDSAMLRGIMEKALTSAPNTNGCVIPARSENDTGNNPHNPMYGINKAGAFGNLVALVGSRTSESGGNSLAPAAMIDPSVRPTKVDRPSDVTGLVDVGRLTELLSKEDIVKVMETMYRASDKKIARIDTGNLTPEEDTAVRETLRCQYVKSAHLANTFGNPADLNPELDIDLVGPAGVFSAEEFASDGEFRKTASVAKMVINGYAGAGTITMGGYDYHTGDRATGERRDLRAGRCIGAVLEYAAKVGVPVMIYVCSDGSVFSNGMLDNSPDGAGKGVWTGDNQQTAASFFLVYNPNGRPQLLGGTPDEQETHRQLGWMRPSGDVETGGSVAANNVNLLVETVVLNYMALHSEQSLFAGRFPQNGMGSDLDSMTAFQPICNGVYTSPV